MLGSYWPLTHSSSCRTIPCQPYTTMWSVYLQLPSIYGGNSLHLQPKNMFCHGGRLT